MRTSATGPVTFMASTYGLARDGLIIEKGAWNLENYRRNPVVLESHNYNSLPIGRTTQLTETDDGLVATIEFDEADSRAMAIRQKIARGYINTVSVGWDTIRQTGNRVNEAELLDISVVAVPGDTNAVALARSAYARTKGGDIPDPTLVKLHKIMMRGETDIDLFMKSTDGRVALAMFPLLSHKQQRILARNIAARVKAQSPRKVA